MDRSAETDNNPFNISKKNVRLLLAGSKVQNHRSCFLRCTEFIRDDLQLANCVSYFLFGVSGDYPEVLQVAMRFMWKHSIELGYLKDFLALKNFEICRLLEPANISIEASSESVQLETYGSPSDMLLSVHKWMSTDPNARLADFLKISENYCLHLVDADVLRGTFVKDPNLQKSEVAKSLYWRTIENKYFSEVPRSPQESWIKNASDPHLHGFSSPNTGSPGSSQVRGRSVIQGENFSGSSPGIQEEEVEVLVSVHAKENAIVEIDLTEDDENPVEITHLPPPAPIVTPAISPKMYFVSGVNNKSLLALDMLTFQTDKIFDFPFDDDCIALISHASWIFAICSNPSRLGGTPLVRYMSRKKKVWLEGPAMPVPMVKFGCVLANESIYAVGGGFGRGREHTTIQRLLIPSGCITGGWVEVAKAPCQRSDHGVGFLKGRICMVGGSSPSNRQGSSLTFHMFDLKEKEWIQKAAMRKGRRGHCIATLNSRLYAIGGGFSPNDGTKYRACEVYDPDLNNWGNVAPMVQPRQNASAFVYEGRIYVVGGNHGQPTMERFDVESNTWTVLKNIELPPEGKYSSVAFSS